MKKRLLTKLHMKGPVSKKNGIALLIPPHKKNITGVATQEKKPIRKK